MSCQGKVMNQVQKGRFNKDKSVSRARNNATEYAMKEGVDAATIIPAGNATANFREEFDDLKLARAGGKKVVDDYLVKRERRRLQQQRDNAGPIAKFEVKGKDRRLLRLGYLHNHIAREKQIESKDCI